MTLTVSGFAWPFIAFTLPVAAMATYLILRKLWGALGPDRDGDRESEAVHRAIAARVALFIMALQVLLMLNLSGVEWIRSWGPRLVVVLFGSVFIAIGNLLPQTRPNLALGIRTAHVERSLFLDSTPSHMRLSLSRARSRHRGGGSVVQRPCDRPHRWHGSTRLCCGSARDVSEAAPCVSAAAVALRVFLALVFVAAGLDKFLGAMWVRVFNDIGFGQWFRYVTGIVEVLGGCLLLVPRATVVAVPVLVCTMAGALLVHITVVGIGPQTVAVSVLVAALVVLWFLHRRSPIPNPSIPNPHP